MNLTAAPNLSASWTLKIAFRLSSVPLILVLAGCVMPGRTAFLEDSNRETLAVGGEHKAIASCVTNVLDTEKWGIWDMPARVTRTNEKGDTVQLEAVNPSHIDVLLWQASFTQVAQNSTSIELIARRNFHPSLSSSYLSEKLEAAIKSCSASQ
jgi:hypothetical protein